MNIREGYQPEFESIRNLLLEMAQERSIEKLLNLIVDRMTARHHVGLTCVWLLKKGDTCSECVMNQKCQNRRKCLHLVSYSAYNHLENKFTSELYHQIKRFPINEYQVGEIAREKKNITITDIRGYDEWGFLQNWRNVESFLGFAGQPLLYKGEVLGVLGIFPLIPAVPDGHIWLRILADHAAIAIVNAEAFEKIEQLKEQVELENEYLRDELDSTKISNEIIGSSQQINQVLKLIEQVAGTDTSVLITGESGTGKELVARAIHQKSLRADKPLIKVNCASIPRTLYESEFFGHVKGAFTGAVKDRGGRFHAADGGTLFLDEIGEIPLDLQGKLLRVLQEGQFERIGDDTTHQVDVRIIAATNKDLNAAIRSNEFREDLFYRVNVFPIHIPPLRERPDDIPLLAQHFLNQFFRKFRKAKINLTAENIDQLQDYNWPGNVRELQNVLERTVIISNGELELNLPKKTVYTVAVNSNKAPVNYSIPQDDPLLTIDDMLVQERGNIIAALKRTNGRVYGENGAAALLKIKPTTLSYRIKKHEIDPKNLNGN